MKKYRCIENTGEVDIRGFYVMGMSSKTDDPDTIGQFGTGNKYGITAILRSGNEVTIYSGSKKIKFTKKAVDFRGQSFEQVVIQLDGVDIESGMTVEMGKLSWTFEQGLREIISNAIDEGKMKISEVDKITSKKGVTRIFIKNTIGVSDFFKYFD